MNRLLATLIAGLARLASPLLQATLRGEIARWGQTVKSAGIRTE